MQLKHVSDTRLHEDLKGYIRQEREVLTIILHHLREVEKRRLYSNYRCASLFLYATKELGYSEDQAGRRISAMRMMTELPEIEEKIAIGSLSLTNVAMARTLFRTEQKIATETQAVDGPCATKEKKLAIISQLEGKTKREAQVIVMKISSDPVSLRPDAVRPVSETHSEYRITVPNEVVEQMKALKGLLAHKFPGLTDAQLLEKLCDLGRREWDPGCKVLKRKSAAPVPARVTVAQSAATEPRVTDTESYAHVARPQGTKAKSHAPARVIATESRVPTAAMRREVWKRDRSQCTKCGSRSALEIDHIKPVALGGSTSLENLRLRCRSCNQRSAIQSFGQNQMGLYLR